ncbi:MarR family transcriptional regulator [Nocardioides gansuensis]|uniref:MarR family transcriptional regulator n=1 Tax=Nocardioides gansuensis TaxID=2138300 RepID=A0A2T8F4N6_9ACTN|nr:MarR family transcriptional regulator [Nocardioides gansuensis]PVG80684.1 MarR family transcriptional regulator [Nocardioides gansuensis]
MASARALTEAHALTQRLFRLSEMAKAAFAEAVAEHGLTPAQARALFFLEEPSPMRALSDHLSCDASNLTGIADRLEAQGLVERVQGEDRRVRLLRLTEEGERVRREVGEHVTRSPSPSDRLTAAERRQLAALLDKMLGE